MIIMALSNERFEKTNEPFEKRPVMIILFAIKPFGSRPSHE